jgi:hypothetical protein
VIVENAFTSISDMVDHIFPVISYFKKYILKIHWPSINRIGNVKTPILFIVGMNDEIVPPIHTNVLYD